MNNINQVNIIPSPIGAFAPTHKPIVIQNWNDVDDRSTYSEFMEAYNNLVEKKEGLISVISDLEDLSKEVYTSDCNSFNEKIKEATETLKKTVLAMLEQVAIILPCKYCEGTGYIEKMYRVDDSKTVKCHSCEGAGC